MIAPGRESKEKVLILTYETPMAENRDKAGAGVRPERLLLAKPRGFCAGVERAVEVVSRALQLFEGPIYVRKEIVHNRHVIESFCTQGVIFVDELDEVPDGGLVIFSAHGVSPAVRTAARERNLQVVDATCPLVTKVHMEALRFHRDGRSLILVGHKGHEEVAGTMGEVPGHVQLVGSPRKPNRWRCLTPGAWPCSRKPPLASTTPIPSSRCCGAASRAW